jgi:hypothetical protein
MSDALRQYPDALLTFVKLSWELMGMTVGSGQTASGVMPVARIDGGGLWKATLLTLAQILLISAALGMRSQPSRMVDRNRSSCRASRPMMRHGLS